MAINHLDDWIKNLMDAQWKDTTAHVEVLRDHQRAGTKSDPPMMAFPSMREVLREALGQAWAVGYAAGHEDGVTDERWYEDSTPTHNPTPNPYEDPVSEIPENCGKCFQCIGNEPSIAGGFLTVGMTMMIVCETCGNKRCPHGTDHNNACTGSNEPGQAGSRYGGI